MANKNFNTNNVDELLKEDNTFLGSLDFDEEFQLSQSNLLKNKSTLKTNRNQRFAALSLNKTVKGALKKDMNEKSVFESDFMNDTLDDIQGTQVLMHNSENYVSNSLITESTSEITLKATRNDQVDVQESEDKKSKMNHLSQFFNSQVLNQIETAIINDPSTSGILSERNDQERRLKRKTTSEEIFNDTNREKIEMFFDRIEHSISMMGVDAENKSENVSKILEILLNTQGANASLNDISSIQLTPNSEKENVQLSMSEINASFASALKQILLTNASKDVSFFKMPINTTIVQPKNDFVEVGPFYGLPLRVKEMIKLYKGIEELYDWQDECLKLEAIKNRKNLIYALPTSGGKTLVAEILMLRELICRKKNAIFILPFVAIVQEKVWALSPFAVALDILIEEYAASKGTYPPRKRRRKNSIYIATIEKAVGLVNSLIETERINEIGLIVVDELHLVGEQGRGSTLEGLLAKIMFTRADIQIIGMSATIGNISDISTFLNAEIYTQNFRPVELIEYVKCGAEIAKINNSNKEEQLFTLARKIDHSYPDVGNTIDPDRLGVLVMEVIPQSSCLIFCPSKKNCENVASLLCRVINKDLLEYRKEEKQQIKHALKDEGGSLCKIFSRSIEYGIAYHHSGLTNEERKVIEDAFRAGIISVICCTSTLAAGVNLPAKRVILRQPYVGKEFITLSKYKQMVGRAGRAGLGETGDSILICNNQDLPKVKKLLMSPMDEALSNLHEAEGKGLRHLVLSCIHLGIAKTRAELQEVSKMTLLNIQSERLSINVKKLTDKVISDLFKLGALQEANFKKSEKCPLLDVTVKMNTSLVDLSAPPCDDSISTGVGKKRKIVLKNDTKLVISKLGCAAIRSNFELTRAHMLYDDLHQAQKSLVLLNSLHLLYLVTPYEIAEQITPNKNNYYNIYSKLGPKELQTARILGIDDSVAAKMLSNQRIKSVPERVLNRFYLTLVLHDLWNEKPVFEVSEKYELNRGLVQNLMTGAATFASNVVNFCEGLEEFWSFAHLLKGMSQRLSHCCVKELVPLMELPAVKQSRAKQLYNAGFKTLQSIANANPENLVESIEFMPRRVAKQLIAAAKMLLLEKVENLREEAEDVLDGANTNSKPYFSETVK